ncbi:hypothetical protein F5Y16DRAFT_52420 [Xylariaceae sp. FL0255]|nr:hypothetical protein F5Y16DRAFT_52420 [Xylariaceae sp. FL0255]
MPFQSTSQSSFSFTSSSSSFSSSSNSHSHSYSSSSSSSRNGSEPQTQRTTYAERTYADDSGTYTERMHQLPGQRPVYESIERPSGHGPARITADNQQQQGQNTNTWRITDVSDEPAAIEEKKN